ncbi:MAG: CDP-diacylglycerol--glycerol-3-phosphate 3-phosphatidyltransferase [Planctomycetes bacterium]|nr:CDP-diacylglycerol--glycerol-3-phosphate 3-phosphatidyltransferase [Planctomycetota bacterium]
MNIFEHWPNRITASRFLGALVLFVVFALWGDRPAEEMTTVFASTCFWLFVVVAATDFLDGWLARRDGHVSAFGRIADPFVDKVLVLGTMIFLATMPWSRGWMPAWVVVAILAREFLVTGIRGYVEAAGKQFPADAFGKLKMVVQCMAVGNIFWIYAFDWPEGWRDAWSILAHVLVGLTVLATIGSGVTYVLKTPKVLSGEQA